MVSNSEPCSLLYNQDAVHLADLQVPSLQHQETFSAVFHSLFLQHAEDWHCPFTANWDHCQGAFLVPSFSPGPCSLLCLGLLTGGTAALRQRCREGGKEGNFHYFSWGLKDFFLGLALFSFPLFFQFLLPIYSYLASLINPNSSFPHWYFFFFKSSYFLTVLGLCCDLQASLVAAHVPESMSYPVTAHRLSCPTARGIPWPGIKPTFPSSGGFLTTGPPGTSPHWHSWYLHFKCTHILIK